MTILGKVLVFVNLMFAVITGAFIVMVFAKQTNWKDNADKWQKNYQVLQGYAKTAWDEEHKLVTDRDQRIAALESDLAKSRQTVQEQQVQLDTANRNSQAQALQLKQSIAAQTAATEESRRLVTENQGLRTLVGEKDKRIVEIETQSQRYKDEMINAQIAYRDEHKRTVQLLDQVRSLTKDLELAQAKAAGKDVTQVAGKAAPEDLEGVVTESSPRDGLATISLGSDAGVRKGNLLYIYRLEPRAEYVGQIEIVDARAHQSVGRAVEPLRAGPIKKGDHVSSTILGRK
jgi:hypothetical protein